VEFSDDRWVVADCGKRLPGSGDFVFGTGGQDDDPLVG
jgi:hypothetical protein